MKKIVFCALAALALTACDLAGLDEKEYDWKIERNIMTWGEDHVYEIVGSIPELEYTSDGSLISPLPKDPTAWVSFTFNPAGYKEFSIVYNEFLGKTPQGTAAMIPMAMEIYARHAATGERCFRLLCGTEANALQVTRELERHFTPSSYSSSSDAYIQRYLPAALLKGAAPSNAYTPSEPYTVQLLASTTRAQKDYCFLNIYTDGGWDSNLRGVELQKLESGMYIVSSCPSCYTQCKTIKGSWPGIK